MFKSKTVFIVGAGASAEIGLPTGAKLIEGMAPQLKFDLDEFSRPTRGDKALFEIIQRHTYSDNRHEYAINLKAHVFAAERISKGLNYAMSIDNFIDIHKDDYRIEFCGKLAIASNILKAERDSSLYVNPDKRHATFDVEKVKKTWFHRFVQILHTGVSVDDVGGIFDNISIITFNYDRCIEHFLLHALRDIYHLESGDTEKLLSGLRIMHPYGTIGRLPWQNSRDPSVEFGGRRELPAPLVEMSRQIKTFTEQLGKNSPLPEIHDAIMEADTIVFLGFAYHPQNMLLLNPPKPSKATRVLGTAFAVSEPDQKTIIEDIAARGFTKTGNIELFNGGCVGLFDQYWRTLSS